MKWQDTLTAEERDQIEQAREARDAAREAYNALMRKIKARADARLRKARAAVG